MPLIDDRKQIQNILETDRTWAAYALADLEPQYFKFATWYSTADRTAICLLYRAFVTRVVLCVGQPQQIDSLLREVDDALGDAQELYAVVRPDTLPVMKKYYRVVEETPMLRMVLDVNSYHSVPHHNARRLGPGDLAAVQKLYTEEPPDFFLSEMLQDGVYYGVFDEGQLIAVAGTHVVAPGVGVAAVGNVYTQKNRRGHGHSTGVTGAVTGHLVENGFKTIVLNVRQDNDPAIHVYEKIGFRPYCQYYEAIAIRGERS